MTTCDQSGPGARAEARETALEDATDPGRPVTYPADAGEFAARWNARTEAERDEFVRGWREMSERSLRCFLMDHEGQLERLRETEARLARIAALCDENDPHNRYAPSVVTISALRAVLDGGAS